jgi:hypothetical protein
VPNPPVCRFLVLFGAHPAGYKILWLSMVWPRGRGEVKGGMTVSMAEEFTAAYTDPRVAQGAARPELLPVRLARACVRVLPVAGVGISMFGTEGIRIPIGASDEDAATAERLQFTAAEGPCLDAHALARSVLATQTLIAQRWPDFHAGLLARTPFRAVAAIPWPAALKGAGTVDLLFRRSRDLADLDISMADEVVAQVEHTLRTQSVIEFSPMGPGPAWLAGPAASSRNEVIIALGMLNVALDVSTPDALALLRGHAYATNRTVDDIAHDVTHRRITAQDLRVGSDQ